LLESYLQFWDEVGRHNPPPLFIIFLLVIYPPRENSGFLKSLPKLWGFDKKSIERKLNGIFLPRQEAVRQDKLLCPSLMLKELNCVVWEDVMDWFSHNGIYDDEKTRREKCDELIKAGDCRRMAGIERELKRIHQEFIRKRGLVGARTIFSSTPAKAKARRWSQETCGCRCLNVQPVWTTRLVTSPKKACATRSMSRWRWASRCS
jgi:hypothetical protein